MRLLIIGILFCSASAGVLAQTVKKDSTAKPVTGGFTLPADTKYLLPDGSIVNTAGFDSARHAWGGRFSMRHDDAHPGLIAVFPITAEDMKRSQEAKARQATLLGEAAPDFDLTDIRGKHYHLKDLRGRLVVLNFWFIGCAPCLAEMPDLNLVRKDPKFADVVFLSLGLDNASAIRKFLKVHPFEYTALTDARAVHADYKVVSCPTSVVIDKQGIVRFIQVSGENIAEKLSPAIRAAM